MCNDFVFNQLKKCDSCGKDPLPYVFVLLGLRLPFHQEAYAVIVHTAEYILGALLLCANCKANTQLSPVVSYNRS